MNHDMCMVSSNKICLMIFLPRSTIELAVQLFCIPVEGIKSESKERFASKLESKILDERTFLMRLETWS